MTYEEYLEFFPPFDMVRQYEFTLSLFVSMLQNETITRVRYLDWLFDDLVFIMISSEPHQEDKWAKFFMDNIPTKILDRFGYSWLREGF
jgi:hypothetical protein